MTRWHVVVGVGLATVVLGGPVQGQPAQPAASPPPARPDDSIFESADIDAKGDAAAATTRARQARDQARCLRQGSTSVDAAARRLRIARSTAAIVKSKEALDKALAKLDRCWDSAFEGTPAAASGAAHTATAQPAMHAHFGFGRIHVEEGPVDGHTIARPLKDHAARYRHCYDQALRHSPTLQGTIHFRVRLERRETHSIPTSVAIPTSSMADDAVRRCVAQAIMTTAFPVHADASTFTFMMAFASVAD
jgi:hypothetical protein